MKRNMFGDAQAEPDDDLTALFEEEHGSSDGLEAERAEFSEEEHLGGWTGLVRNAACDEILVRSCESKEALEAYLAKHHVSIT